MTYHHIHISLWHMTWKFLYHGIPNALLYVSLSNESLIIVSLHGTLFCIHNNSNTKNYSGLCFFRFSIRFIIIIYLQHLFLDSITSTINYFKRLQYSTSDIAIYIIVECLCDLQQHPYIHLQHYKCNKGCMYTYIPYLYLHRWTCKRYQQIYYSYSIHYQLKLQLI